MDELLISPYLLAAIFFVVALAYSSVGLGGGSSYTSLLTVFGVGYVFIPTISLTMNLVVTTAGSINFIRKKHTRFGLLVPFLATSFPAAYLGGILEVPKIIFYWLLLVSLVFVALRIYLWKSTRVKWKPGPAARLVLSLLLGAVLGLLGGMLGIGGGIYLVPFIIILGLGDAKQAAACGSIFIWVNSLSGLVARVQYQPMDWVACLPLIGAVLAGGILGSYLGSSKLNPRTMEKILGGIVLVAIGFLVHKVWVG